MYSKKSCVILKKNNKGGLSMIAIGADHGGYKLKEEIKKFFEEKNIEYKDYGTLNFFKIFS